MKISSRKLLSIAPALILLTGCATITSKTEPVAAVNQFHQEAVVKDLGIYSLISLPVDETNSTKYTHTSDRQRQDPEIMVNKLRNYCQTIGGQFGGELIAGLLGKNVNLHTDPQALLWSMRCTNPSNGKYLFAGNQLKYVKYQKDYNKGYDLYAKEENINYIDLFIMQPKGDISNETFQKDFDLVMKKIGADFKDK